MFWSGWLHSFRSDASCDCTDMQRLYADIRNTVMILLPPPRESHLHGPTAWFWHLWARRLEWYYRKWKIQWRTAPLQVVKTLISSCNCIINDYLVWHLSRDPLQWLQIATTAFSWRAFLRKYATNSYTSYTEESPKSLCTKRLTWAWWPKIWKSKKFEPPVTKLCLLALTRWQHQVSHQSRAGLALDLAIFLSLSRPKKPYKDKLLNVLQICSSIRIV